MGCSFSALLAEISDTMIRVLLEFWVPFNRPVDKI